MPNRIRRNLGEPTVVVRYAPATPEEIAENRLKFSETVSEVASSVMGMPVQATIFWGEKPAHYGETRICRGEEVIYPEEVAFDDLPQWAQEALRNWREANT